MASSSLLVSMRVYVCFLLAYRIIFVNAVNSRAQGRVNDHHLSKRRPISFGNGVANYFSLDFDITQVLSFSTKPTLFIDSTEITSTSPSHIGCAGITTISVAHAFETNQTPHAKRYNPVDKESYTQLSLWTSTYPKTPWLLSDSMINRVSSINSFQQNLPSTNSDIADSINLGSAGVFVSSLPNSFGQMGATVITAPISNLQPFSVVRQLLIPSFSIDSVSTTSFTLPAASIHPEQTLSVISQIEFDEHNLPKPNFSASQMSATSLAANSNPISSLSIITFFSNYPLLQPNPTSTLEIFGNPSLLTSIPSTLVKTVFPAESSASSAFPSESDIAIAPLSPPLPLIPTSSMSAPASMIFPSSEHISKSFDTYSSPYSPISTSQPMIFSMGPSPTDPCEPYRDSNLVPSIPKTKLVIFNNCTETIWPAITTQWGMPPHLNGFELESRLRMETYVGRNWQGRVWARTNCSFNEDGTAPAGNKPGRACLTGDCAGMRNCKVSGEVPATLAEFTLSAEDNRTYYDISLVDGYNIPVAILVSAAGSFLPNETNPICVASRAMLADASFDPYKSKTSSANNGLPKLGVTALSSPGMYMGTNATSPLKFETDVTHSFVSEWCPWELQANPPKGPPLNGQFIFPDGDVKRPIFNPCFSACAKTGDPSVCCAGFWGTPQTCERSEYSRLAKKVCPDAYSFAYDDLKSTFVVPADPSAEFTVAFCPTGRSTNILKVLQSESGAK